VKRYLYFNTVSFFDKQAPFKSCLSITLQLSKYHLTITLQCGIIVLITFDCIFMNIEQTILKIASEKDSFTTADILRALKNKITRQAVVLVLQRLVKQGKIIKGGSTRSSFYFLPKYTDKFVQRVKASLVNKNLEEHRVFSDLKEKSYFIKNLSENVYSILEYSFDEMLNNAIDHSETKNIEVDIQSNGKDLKFIVEDFGVGVFNNVIDKKKLESEMEAMQDLLKGKTTTAPKAHSGEGIFFTSKAVDEFILDSFGWRLRIDNIIKDVFMEEIKPVKKGTKVTCVISEKSERHLGDVFKKYESDDGEMDFDKTEVLVRLFTIGTVHVSRSQARRVLVGLEKFKVIIMDFDKVPTVGQAFADEIFRVFKMKYPDVKVIPKNMNKAVEFMVNRVEKE